MVKSRPKPDTPLDEPFKVRAQDEAFQLCVRLIREGPGGTPVSTLLKLGEQFVAEANSTTKEAYRRLAAAQCEEVVVLACCYILAAPRGAFRRSGSKQEQHSYRRLKTTKTEIEQAVRLILETHSHVYKMDWLYGLPSFYRSEADKNNLKTCMDVLVEYPQRIIPALEQIQRITQQDFWRNEVLFFLVEYIKRMRSGSRWKGPPWQDLADVIGALGEDSQQPDALRKRYEKIKRAKSE